MTAYPTHPPINGYAPGIDPIAHALGALDAGQRIILHQLDRQDKILAEIQQALAESRQAHRDLTARTVAIEARGASAGSSADSPRLSVADFKLTLAAVVFVVLVVLGKIELAQQVIMLLVGK